MTTPGGGHQPNPDVEYVFGHDPAASRGARQALAPLFPEPCSFAEDVTLAASELVSNVVQHTDDGGSMHAWNEDPLRLEVHDHSPSLPTVRIDADHSGGRGLHIVDAVATDWGISSETDGKVVWAEFERPAD
jgi:hypothetical protein